MGKFSGIGAIVTPHVWRDVITNAENNVLILAIAGGLGLLASIVCASGLSKLPFALIGKAVFSGLKSSLLPIAILVLAWSLKAACDGLHTGLFLAATVEGVLSSYGFQR